MALGSVGLSGNEPAAHGDLEAVYQGGKTFADRMQAFTAQTADWAAKRDEALKALDALAIGKDVAGARARAKATQDAASKLQDDAAQALILAKEQAAKIVADAKAQAEAIVLDAMSSASNVKAEAEETKKGAVAFAAKSNKDKSAALADAKAQQKAMADQLAASQKAQKDAADAKAASDAAIKQAQETQKLFQDKLAKLQAVISG